MRLFDLPAIATCAMLALFVIPVTHAAETAVADQPTDDDGYSIQGANTCLGCHADDVTKAIFTTKHGQRADGRTPFGDGNTQCEACHGPGGEHIQRLKSGQKASDRPSMPFWGSDSTASTAEHNQQCMACHKEQVGLHWSGSVHDAEDLNCADCHTVHATHQAVLRPETQAQVCYTCHLEQRANAQKPFAHPLRFGRMACTDCHNPHGSAAEYSLVRNTVNDTCYGCHQEKRGPLLWEHAPVTEDCSYCHEPHGTIHAGMLKRTAPLLCQSCHSQAGHPSVPYTSAGLAGGSAPSQYLLSGSCLNCHSQVHGSNHPSGGNLMR